MRFTQRRIRPVVAALAAAATIAALTSIAGPANAVSPRHVLPDSSPHWLSHAKKVATPATASKVSFGVLLNLRNAAQAQAQVQALSDPSSKTYGQWLTNKQFNASYAPAASDVAAVKSWLSSQGFAVGATTPSGQYVPATGTTAQVEKAFGTTLGKFSYQGKTVQTNTTSLSLPTTTPSAVLASVNGVVGLDQASTLKQPVDTLPGPPAGSRYGVQPCSAYYGQKIATDKPSAYGKKQPYAVCGYGSKQLQEAYGETYPISQGITGKGVTVAITDAYASPTIAQDAATYAARQGQPAYKKGQFTQITPGPDQYTNTDLCGASGWYGEETLDVEAVHAMAPGAKIVYVGGQDCVTGLDQAWAASIDNHVADIITNSWTDGVDDLADLGQSYVDFYNQYSLEAALTGITVTYSTGDNGDGTAGGTSLADKTVGFPADLPLVTGVGGTSVLINKQNQWAGEYGWQSAYSAPLAAGSTSWGTLPGTYSSGGTGGTSTLFTQPFYQKGVVPTSISEANGTTPMRSIPDISMVGDPNTGMLVGQTQAFADGTYYDEYRIGGTSLSSPLLAGVLAVASQYSHKTLGFVNPLYYKMLNTSAVHDIKAPTSPVAQVRTNYVNGIDNSAGKQYLLQTIDVQTSTIHSTRGYDDETGVGTPNGILFFRSIKALAKGK